MFKIKGMLVLHGIVGMATSTNLRVRKTSRQLDALTVIVGQIGTPRVPLLKCQGDCDTNAECDGELKCFVRMGREPVPGCSGQLDGSRTAISFCFNPNDLSNADFIEAEEAADMANDNNPSGDWRNWSPSFFASSPNEENTIPAWTGISTSSWGQDPTTLDQQGGNQDGGNPSWTDISTSHWGQTLNPTPNPTSDVVAEGLLSLSVLVGLAGTPVGLLYECEGSCDNDDECGPGLICLKRGGQESVPGCSGNIPSRSGLDFCIKDPNGAPPMAITSFPVAAPSDAPVVAPIDSTEQTEDVRPGPNDYPGSNMITYVGEDQVLGRCEGDCDDDSECASDMVCYQRTTSYLSNIPGCLGLGDEGEDYCIDPLDNPSNIHSDTFRIKLFWREGYFWQEERIERAWCMQCDGTACQEGDKVRISVCDRRNTEFLFINIMDEVTQVKLEERNLCLEVSENSEETDVLLARCDESKDAQKFFSGAPGFEGSEEVGFGKDRFELQPMLFPTCVTQRHHPKEAEKLYQELCTTARKDDTSLWNRY